MHADPLLPRLVASILVVLTIGLVLRRLRQPHVLAYLLAGVAMGPFGLAAFTDTDAISRLGDLGLILLMFFIGMEMSLPRLAANWRIAIAGTVLQILLSVAAIWALGSALDWPTDRVVLIGFVISLSSTAVAVGMLRGWGHLESELGRDVLGILIVQDLFLAPMLLTLGFLETGVPGSLGEIARPVLGLCTITVLGWWLLRRDRIQLPFGSRLRHDHELQVFAAAFTCLSMALVTSYLGLSTALGAFLAGIVVSSSTETEWVARSLEPFRVILVALFFVSIGLLVDVDFIRRNAGLVGVMVGALFLTNTFVNASIVRFFGRDWRHSLFAGAVLAQAGDFSFVLAAVGLESGVITGFGYQLTVSVIFGSLLFSPFWVRPFRRLAERASSQPALPAEEPEHASGDGAHEAEERRIPPG